MSTFTKREDTYPSSRAVGWRGERRKRGEKGNGSGEIVGCRRGRLECLFFFSSSLGSKRRVLETKRRLASRPRARATCGVGVSDPERERGRAERERACLRSLPLCLLSSPFHSQREREQVKRLSAFIVGSSLPPRKRKRKRNDSMRCSSALALAALAALALCASAKSAATAPFVNWSSLREGAPRDKHVEALQLAKVRMMFSSSMVVCPLSSLSSLAYLLLLPCFCSTPSSISPLQRAPLAARDTCLDSVSGGNAVVGSREGGQAGDALGTGGETRAFFSLFHFFLSLQHYSPAPTPFKIHPLARQGNPRSAFELWTSAYEKVYKDEQVREKAW